MRFLFKPLIPIIIFIFASASLLLLEERRTFDVSTLVHIDPIPQTKHLIHQKKYAEAYEYLTFFMKQDYVKNNPESKMLLQKIDNIRSSYSYKTQKFFEGIVKGGSDEDIGRASAIASDFLVFGDVRDLSIEGKHYINKEKVDKLIVALSSIGLVATASTLYTVGATAPIKSSISLLKYGRRVNKIPDWLQKSIIHEATIAKKTKSLEKIKLIFKPIQEIYNKVGLNRALDIIKVSKGFESLKNLAKFSSRFGKESPVLLRISNNQAGKYAKMLPNVKRKSFIYASTYGEKGLKGLTTLGENKFIKRLKFNSNLLKTTYKGNFNSLFNALLSKIPTQVLLAIALGGLYYFGRKFLRMARPRRVR